MFFSGEWAWFFYICGIVTGVGLSYIIRRAIKINRK